MYLDPGGLSYLIQFLIAGLLAGFFWFKNLKNAVKRLFTKGKEQDPDDRQ